MPSPALVSLKFSTAPKRICSKKNFKHKMPVASKRPQTKNRAGKEQLETLVSYMENHSLFARGQIMKLGPQGHLKYQNMWASLTDHLNTIGPCNKNVSAWQETWKKMRADSKKRKAAFLLAYNKTGHINPNVKLLELDERITDIFGKHGLGLSTIPESGYSNNRGNNNVQTYQIKIKLSTCNINKYLAPEICDAQTIDDREVKRTMNKPTAEQKYSMLEFMEGHQQFAVNPTANDPLWEDLLIFLHADGQPVRTLKAWQKSWSDHVRSAQQSFMLMKEGGGEEPLSEFQFRIVKLLTMKEGEDISSSSYNLAGNKRPKMDGTNKDVQATLEMPSTSRFNITTSSNTTNKIVVPSSSKLVVPNYHKPPTQAPAPKLLNSLNNGLLRKDVSTPQMPLSTKQSILSSSSASSTATSQTYQNKSMEPQRKAEILLAAFNKSQETVIRKIEECFQEQNKILQEFLETQQSALSSFASTMAGEIQKGITEAFNNIIILGQSSDNSSNEIIAESLQEIDDTTIHSEELNGYVQNAAL